MKFFLRVVLAVLMLPCVVPAARELTHQVSVSGVWSFSHPVYGQLRIVPAGGEPDSKPGEEHDWNGPWEKYPRFQMFVTYNEGERFQPKAYKFVQPIVGLAGMADLDGHNEESHSEGVELFDGPSAPADIRVEQIPIEGTPVLDKEYRIAALTGPNEKLAWDIYVRFQEAKPDYVKPVQP